MFSGIVTDIGRVRTVQSGPVTRFEIGSNWNGAEIPIGASVCHDGVCLTVAAHHGRGWVVEAGPETLSRTTLGRWSPDRPVNLERSLAVGGELGGHIVFGHVDGVATLVGRNPADADAVTVDMTFDCPGEFGRFIAVKGSVTLNGVSLTVTEVADGASGRCAFSTSVIPHTLRTTTLAGLRPGDPVNFEVDMLARYVDRLISAKGSA